MRKGRKKILPLSCLLSVLLSEQIATHNRAWILSDAAKKPNCRITSALIIGMKAAKHIFTLEYRVTGQTIHKWLPHLMNITKQAIMLLIIPITLLSDGVVENDHGN